MTHHKRNQLNQWGTKIVTTVLATAMLFNMVFAPQAAQAATAYTQTFEAGVADWTSTTQTGSGTNGIASSGGSFHGTATAGAFTLWGGYENSFPANGYTTSMDIYLDMALADGTDKRLDFSSAINNPSGAHRRDFIIHLGTNPSTPGQWAVSASNTVPGWPLNPGRSPQAITETGWYTISHEFRNNGLGVLEVEVSLVKAGGTTIGSWLLSDPTDVIGSTVGGHRYGWFAGNFNFPSVAIDNAQLVTAALPVVAPCASTTSLHTTDITGWDLTQTRSQGLNQIVSGGLAVETWSDGDDGTPDQKKAAGYYATDFALSEAGVPNIELASFTGVRPSLQLGIDKDANGSRDAYLVYEPWAYGEGNYWATAYLGVPAGMGYDSFGTLNDYLVANPNARIVQIGYSLGSGVVGEAVITKLTAGCVDYTFGLAPVTPPVTPGGSGGNTGGGTPTTTSTASATTALTPFFQNFAVTFNDDGTIGATATPQGETDNGDILGTEDEATSTDSNQSDDKDSSGIFGLSWYWLLAGLGGLGILWWLWAAAKRRKDDKQNQ